jgi:hypothetical protein
MITPVIQFKNAINLGAMLEAERAWKIIDTNDKLLRVKAITREEWFRRRDALVVELKTKGL